ncbi:MAG: VOC family protein [Sphingomonadales bacterium]|nr:VOC family protein [Sphingomonadales bacterium]
MNLAMHATKLVVGDVDAAERFYVAALGLKVASRNLGGEDEVRQQQTWLSATGDMSAHILILSRFLELPEAPRAIYPGEVWLCFQVPDVDATVAAAVAAGGALFRAGEDRPEHGVRAAVISDNEGHYIELVGPMSSG